MPPFAVKSVRVDAADGFAHPAFEATESALIEAAHGSGIAMMGITNDYACGVLGYFTRRLAERGLVAIMAANASSTMAPCGGRMPFFGTNPWSFAAPRARGALVIDSSSSATAFVNMATALAAGLTGAHWSFEASSLGNDEGGPPRLGQTIIAIRSEGTGGQALAGRLEAMLQEMTREPGVRAPGDRREAERLRTAREGVILDADLARQLAELGARI